MFCTACVGAGGARIPCHRLWLWVALLGFAIVLPSCERAQPDQTTVVRFLSSSPRPGPFVVDLVRGLDSAIADVHVLLSGTPGSLSLVSDLQRGDGEVGIAQADIVSLAYRQGLEGHEFPHTNLRGVAVLWTNAVQIIVSDDSAIHSVEDLSGQRIGVGPIGSAGEFYARTVLEAYGLDHSTVEEYPQPVSEMPVALRRGSLDAAIAVTVFDPSFLGVSSQLRLLSIDQKMVDYLRSQYLFVKPLVLPSGALDADSIDVHTVGVDALLVCHKDLEDELVYRLVSAFFSLVSQLMHRHVAASLVDPDLGPTTPIPLHPGAARYYREREILR